ncbi:hypothetical protein RFI_25744 [Reticulomyxa filosa]|uniref:Uncharacterized protein n=1 Tax=Reticulomyxa filosa TaxID=46433 RepID=X6MDX9_RETFI|nr:hypothetical protein RFI_25744 [Reticulomyxa filosa]|eukprot:ETO11632.1 hypothetical protein RFI_25744 [Reticulomyxa filosa]
MFYPFVLFHSVVGENCLKDFFKNNGNICPIMKHCDCKYSKANFLNQLIGNLPVMCIRQFEHNLNGSKCNFNGRLKDLQYHLDNDCPFNLTDCWFKPFGCNHVCHKRDLNGHLVSRIKFHFELVMKLFKSMKQDIQLYKMKIDDLNFEISALNEDLTYKIENLQKELLKSKEMLSEYQTKIKFLEENNSKLPQDYQRLTNKKITTDFDIFRSSSKLLKTIDGHTGFVLSIDYSTFDQLICSGSNDKTIRVWNVMTSKQIGLFKHCVMYKTIRFWDFKHNQQLQKFNEHTDAICGIELSPFNNGKYLCSGSFDKTVRLWDINISKSLYVFSGHTNTVCCVDFSPLQGNNNNNNNNNNNIGVIGGNGYKICSGSFDNTIRIWDIETTKQFNVFEGHKGRVHSVRYGLKNGGNVDTILSGSSDASVGLWDIRSGQQIQAFYGHKDYVHAVEYSPFVIKNDINVGGDSSVICSGSKDNMIRFWDIRSNKQ